ncbi:CMRF35-like molecule 8 isoform X2 [Silurus meridionalis]|uniref:CMRF35-like molecule 8 isoform X2 n=1 Tax=Silurus meridionalis TaxID=175797 RepID=UPI001EEBF048|nr:CMRF35-like molecule 8 isoform X2 [Silurus meridionalis]
MMKCLYLLSVVFQMAAGCALEKNHKEITQHKGDSVLIPCSCSDLLSKPQTFTWETFRTGRLTEVLNDEHYRGRYQLFNNISPANLSLLISDLREEDQGIYRCSTEKEHRDIILYVKGCELVKKTGVEKVTGFIGESVVLPCVCTDLQNDPKRVTWEFNKNNHFQEIYSKQTGNHSNRVKLVSKNPPGNLSLLISDLTEEDQGTYICSVQADSIRFSLSVKVGGRETSTQPRKTDTTPISEEPHCKTATTPPSSSSTTQDTYKTSVATVNQNIHNVGISFSLVIVILMVLLLLISSVVAFVCWRCKGGRCVKNIITDVSLNCKGKPEDKIMSEDALFTTVTYTCYSTDAH